MIAWRRVPSLPMRDWNIFRVLFFLFFKIVPSLPMRDWNCKRMRYNDTSVRWFPAYLWGIETSFSLSLGAREFYRSQPTYEGLKLIMKRGKYAIGTRSQPTYEGLKQLERCLASTMLPACSQPTYEGLKLLFQNSVLLSFLPFPAYLWGIETLIFGEEEEHDSCSQPTYEGLKRLTTK